MNRARLGPRGLAAAAARASLADYRIKQSVAMDIDAAEVKPVGPLHRQSCHPVTKREIPPDYRKTEPLTRAGF